MSKTGLEIATKILNKVDDPSYTTEEALDLVNECASMLTSMVLFSRLESEDTIDTMIDSNEVPLPDDYSRNLFYCMNVEQNREQVIMGSTVQLRRYYPRPGRAGRVHAVVDSDGILFYSDIPNPVETLTIRYHRKPELITEAGYPDFTTPENEYFVEMAMYHYGCQQLFDSIEDGEDGKQPNTDRHEAHFIRYLGLVKSKTKSKSYRAPQLMRGCF